MTDLYEVAHWVDGAKYTGTPAGQADIFNPATGRVQGKLLLGSMDDLEAAVASATAAFPAWANRPPLARARVMFKFLSLLQSNAEKLADCLGKARDHLPATYFPVGAAKDYEKVISSDMANEILSLIGCLAEQVSQRIDDIIAAPVTKRIVVGLEFVDIDVGGNKNFTGR